MEIEITEKNLGNLLDAFGENVGSGDSFEKIVMLGRFAISILATVTASIADDRADAKKALKLAMKDCEAMINRSYDAIEAAGLGGTH